MTEMISWRSSAWEDWDEGDDETCLDCGEPLTNEEMRCGAEFCFDCYVVKED